LREAHNILLLHDPRQVEIGFASVQERKGVFLAQVLGEVMLAAPRIGIPVLTAGR